MTETPLKTPRDIARAMAKDICEHYRLPVMEVMGNTWSPPLVIVRAHIYYALRTCFGWDYKRIGEMFNYRDASTVRSGVAKHKERIRDGVAEQIELKQYCQWGV